MNFPEQPASNQWAALKFDGETIAEVQFKPDGEPLGLLFRIPRNSFQISCIAERLTTENLLKAAAIAPEEVESWHYADLSRSGLNESNLQLRNPLPQPTHDVPHLDVYVRLKPPRQAAACNESGDLETALAKWQELEARWKAILGSEAFIDTLRISMEGLWAEMESLLKRMLTTEEKLHALSADVSQWNKAKSRVRFTLPKAKDFIHRATWAKGTPERKKLDEVFKNDTGATIPVPQMGEVFEELEVLRKNLQVLSAQGMAVSNECKAVSADVQGALSRLQSNSAARRAQKRGRLREKRKST